MAPVIAYWPVRGLVNATRLMLEHVGEKYDYESYGFGAQRGAKDDWASNKFSLGLPFPNLPYLKDGSTTLTQSEAIIRHYARKHGLVPKTEEENQQHDVVNGVLGDLRAQWVKLMYGPDFDTNKAAYRANSLVPILKQLDTFLTNKDHVLGSRLTYVDFTLFELLDINSKLFPDVLNEFPNLNKFHKKIAGLKGVKEFLASDRMHKAMNAPFANFGGN